MNYKWICYWILIQFHLISKLYLIWFNSTFNFIAIDATQCCGTFTRAINGQVRKCNSIWLLRCSWKQIENPQIRVVCQQRTIIIFSMSIHRRSQRENYKNKFTTFLYKLTPLALTKQFSSKLKYSPNMFVDLTCVRVKHAFKRIVKIKTSKIRAGHNAHSKKNICITAPNTFKV